MAIGDTVRKVKLVGDSWGAWEGTTGYATVDADGDIYLSSSDPRVDSKFREITESLGIMYGWSPQKVEDYPNAGYQHRSFLLLEDDAETVEPIKEEEVKEDPSYIVEIRAADLNELARVIVSLTSDTLKDRTTLKVIQN